MSKKKAFSGSTMTLKDFHGGSIPSDLPLPSAPGTVARNFERPGLDRTNPAAWGSSLNRSDHRRPGSAAASRNFDEKTSIFLHPPHIGRNFDEDERKPLDSGSRRNSDEDDSLQHSRSDRFSHNHPDPKPSETKASSRLQITGTQAPKPAISNVPGRPASVNGNPVRVPNVWARNEVGFHGEATQASVPPAPSSSAASKLASASAIEKVSSGIWQSKLVISSHQCQPSVYQPELQCKGPDMEGDSSLGNSTYTEIDPFQSHSLQIESTRAVDMDQADDRRRYNDNRRYVEDLVPSKEAEFGGYDKEGSRSGRPISAERKLGAQQQGEAQQGEASGRPKLKLLPRTKPMEPQNSYIDDYKPYNSGNVETREAIRPPTSDFAAADENSKAAERRRLNLKPRSQPLEQSEKAAERGRKTVFGGARPRELVLKERGVDDVAIIGAHPVQPPSRGKHELQRPDAKMEVAAQHFRHADRVENVNADQRDGYWIEHTDMQSDRHDFERKDIRVAEKAAVQRGSRKNDNWRDEKNGEKLQEHHKEPESWRKPEHVKSPETQALCYGRAASAVDLVQAFSGSVSGAGKPEVIHNTRSLPSRLVGSGSVPGRSSVPFSRLLESGEMYAGSTQCRINGY